MPALILLLALALDLLLGDPPNRYHPVVLMGHFIRRMARLAPQEGATRRFVHGTVLVLSGVALFSLPLAWALVWVRKLNPLVYLLLAALLLKATFAYMGLVKAARQVKAALERGDLPEARRLVSWHLVSRDTSQLDASLVAAAAVESVAENITDGIVAPLLFFALAGLPGAWAYRFVNTCDSMLGYRDPFHEHLGKFAARLDDVLNFIPARLAGLLLVAAAGLVGEDTTGAWQTMWHQHGRTASPNAGWTMSAMAGALGVTLEKVGHYRLEGGCAPPGVETIDRALKVAAVTVGLFAFALCAVLTVAYICPIARWAWARHSPHMGERLLAMPIPPRPETEKLTPAIHGGPDYAELAALGLSPDEVIDFSANANPYGPSPQVRAALAGVPLDRYPDAQAIALRERLAQVHGLAPDHIIVGNGTAELIWLLGMAYLQRGDPVVIIGPTFGEYRAAAGLMGAGVAEYRAPATADFRPDVAAIEALIGRQRPRLTFLCNPNNPTGIYLAQVAVEALAAACGEGLLVVDEAYRAFVAEPWPSEPLIERGPGLSPGEGNVVLLRSMTKDHALAGLRLGYALASPEVVATLKKVQPSWSVNAAAQVAGLAVLSDADHLPETLPQIAAAKAYLVEELTRLGLRVVPSAANFLLVEVGDGQTLRRTLLSHGLMVRDCTSFGLPEYVRIAARRLEECRQLIETLRQLLIRDS